VLREGEGRTCLVAGWVGFGLGVEVDGCRRNIWDVLLMLMCVCVCGCGVDEGGGGRQHREVMFQVKVRDQVTGRANATAKKKRSATVVTCGLDRQ
jgi:hypothetical protein